ncbi:MAG: alpha/beta hydrolase [Anaerolineales bacterium]|jgi:pimeloyl-ACP methyl ester carboxylesterase
MTAQNADKGAFESGTENINDHALYWERHGDPETGTILLLHHGLGSARSWRRQIPALSGAGWEVIAYDRWGYGRSDPRPGFSDRFLLEDAQEAFYLLDRLEVEDPALLGHSDGGTIALLMASMQPNRISKLIVVAAHIYYEDKMRAGLQLIAKQAQQPPLVTALKKEHGERAESLTKMWIDHWLQSDPTGIDMSDRLDQIHCPVLVIQGELDEHASPQHAEDIAHGVKQGELWLVPEIAHMPPHEIPEQFNQRVVNFLAQEA